MKAILKIYYILDGLVLFFVTAWIIDGWIFDIRLFNKKLWAYGLIVGFFVVPIGFKKILSKKKIVASDELTKYKQIMYSSNILLAIWWGISCLFVLAILSVLFFGI